jgi:hypothetical protein
MGREPAETRTRMGEIRSAIEKGVDNRERTGRDKETREKREK